MNDGSIGQQPTLFMSCRSHVQSAFIYNIGDCATLAFRVASLNNLGEEPETACRKLQV